MAVLAPDAQDVEMKRAKCDLIWSQIHLLRTKASKKHLFVNHLYQEALTRNSNTIPLSFVQ